MLKQFEIKKKNKCFLIEIVLKFVLKTISNLYLRTKKMYIYFLDIVLQSIILSLMLKEGQSRNRNREHVYMKRRCSSWL